MEYSFDSEIKRFISHLDSIEQSMPIIMLLMVSIGKKTRKDMKDFLSNLEEDIDEDGNEFYKIPISKNGKFRKLKRREESYSLAQTVIPRSLLVSIVSIYDAYLGRLIRTMFAVKPEMLNALQKNITLSDLLTYNSIEDVKEYMIEKEIESVLRDSHSDHFDWLEKKLDIPLRKGLDIWPAFIEVTERRNLFVHCDGVISSQYLSVCNKYDVKFDKEYKVGEVLYVNGRYFKNALNCMYEVGIKLGHVLWRKLYPMDIESADKSLNDNVYDFIIRENYDIAISILEFAVNVLKKNDNGEYKYFYIINLAQSYKWKGEDKKCKELIEKVDWSPLSNSFRLANAVLRDDFSDAAMFMRRIGNSGEVERFDYNEWPLFKKFRETQEFKDAYYEIFREPFEITELATETKNDSENLETEGDKTTKMEVSS